MLGRGPRRHRLDAASNPRGVERAESMQQLPKELGVPVRCCFRRSLEVVGGGEMRTSSQANRTQTVAKGIEGTDEVASFLDHFGNGRLRTTATMGVGIDGVLNLIFTRLT